MQLNQQLEKDVGNKVLQFITRWRSQSSLVTKPYDVQTQYVLQEKDELGHISLVHNMLVKNFCIYVHQLWRPLKQSLYMFRVMRKECSNIYSRIGVKIRTENLLFINLDRYPIYRAAIEHQAKTTFSTSIDTSYRASCRDLKTNTSSLVSWTDSHGFNTWSRNLVLWSIKHILDLPNYK